MKQAIFSNEEYEEALAQLDQLMQDAENITDVDNKVLLYNICLLYTSPSPRDRQKSRMPSSA